MDINFTIPVRIRIADNNVQNYVENEESVDKRVDKTIESITNQLANSIAEDFLKENVNIITVEINGKGILLLRR